MPAYFGLQKTAGSQVGGKSLRNRVTSEELGRIHPPRLEMSQFSMPFRRAINSSMRISYRHYVSVL